VFRGCQHHDNDRRAFSERIRHQLVFTLEDIVMFDSEVARAVLFVIAHPAFQGIIALLGLIIGIITAMVSIL
jgi:hypothetical protein